MGNWSDKCCYNCSSVKLKLKLTDNFMYVYVLKRMLFSFEEVHCFSLPEYHEASILSIRESVIMTVKEQLGELHFCSHHYHCFPVTHSTYSFLSMRKSWRRLSSKHTARDCAKMSWMVGLWY